MVSSSHKVWRAPCVCGTGAQRRVCEHLFDHVHALHLQTPHDIQHLQNHLNALACSSQESPWYATVNHRHCTTQVSLEVRFATMELLQHPPDTSQNDQEYPKKETTHCLLHSLFKAKNNFKNSFSSGSRNYKAQQQSLPYENSLGSKQQQIRGRKPETYWRCYNGSKGPASPCALGDSW